eukprot:s30_g11.t1
MAKTCQFSIIFLQTFTCEMNTLRIWIYGLLMIHGLPHQGLRPSDPLKKRGARCAKARGQAGLAAMRNSLGCCPLDILVEKAGRNVGFAGSPSK